MNPLKFNVDGYVDITVSADQTEDEISWRHQKVQGRKWLIYICLCHSSHILII